jgi:hypothetical protein
MRPDAFRLALGIGSAFVVSLLVLLLIWVPPVPPPSASCGPPPTAPNYASFPAQDTKMVFADYGGGRYTVWSNASASYAIYLQDQAQYSAYVANGSGFNRSMHASPPTEFAWTSGPTTRNNHTLALGAGEAWYLLVSNPQPVALVVNLQLASCAEREG